MADDDPLLDALTGAQPTEETEGVMPDFVRRAIIAQGKCDPDEIAMAARDVDLDAVEAEEIAATPKPPPVHQDVLDFDVPIPTRDADV